MKSSNVICTMRTLFSTRRYTMKNKQPSKNLIRLAKIDKAHSICNFAPKNQKTWSAKNNELSVYHLKDVGINFAWKITSTKNTNATNHTSTAYFYKNLYTKASSQKAFRFFLKPQTVPWDQSLRYRFTSGVLFFRNFKTWRIFSIPFANIRN